MKRGYFGSSRHKWGNLCLHQTAWWGWEDSNFQPNDYQSLALSVEYRTRLWRFPGWRSAQGGGCVYEHLVSANSRLNFNEIVSARSSLLPTEPLFGYAMRLLPRKTEHLVLPGPFGRRIGEASNAHAMRQPAIDGRFDQIGREESQRDGHVDFSRAAVFSRRDAVRTRCWISDEFIKPTTAVGNRRDQSRARFCTHGASVLRPDPLGEEDLTA